VDRKKNLIVMSTGKNVAPQPVESSLVTSRFIQQAVLVGNNRPYISALLVPDYEALTRHAQENGWAAKTKEELARLGQTRQLLQKEMDRLTAEFAPFERPKKFAVLTEPFTLEKEELTPTLKVRTRVVEKKYADTIEALYSDEDHEAVIPASREATAKPGTSDAPPVVTLFQTSDSTETSEPLPKRSTRLKQTVLSRQVFFGILIGVLAGVIFHVLF